MPAAPGKMTCSYCGVELNRHAEKIVYKSGSEPSDGVEPALGGPLEEFHTCPNCGRTESRPA
jgi:uncharacterized protein with PIN domain